MTQEAAVPASHMQQIRQIAREEAAAVYRSAALRSASIGEGGALTINGGELKVLYPAADGGGTSVLVGDQYSGSTFLGTGLLVQAPDGTDMIIARQDEFFGNTRVDIYDSHGRVIFGNDAGSEQGLARPYIPFTAYLSRNSDWPTTTSTTFTTIYRAKGTKQQPKIYVETWLGASDPAAIGEVRIMVNNVQVGTTLASTAGFVSGLNFGPVAVDGDHMSTLSIEVQARLASGTGSVSVGIGRVEGRQT